MLPWFRPRIIACTSFTGQEHVTSTGLAASARCAALSIHPSGSRWRSARGLVGFTASPKAKKATRPRMGTCVAVVYSYTNTGSFSRLHSAGGWGVDGPARLHQSGGCTNTRAHWRSKTGRIGHASIVRDSVFARCAGENPAAIINAWGTQPVRVGSSFLTPRNENDPAGDYGGCCMIKCCHQVVHRNSESLIYLEEYNSSIVLIKMLQVNCLKILIKIYQIGIIKFMKCIFIVYLFCVMSIDTFSINLVKF